MSNRMHHLFLLAGACLAGCYDGEFTGDAGRIRFNSNLGPSWKPWTPSQSVAPGATMQFDAVDIEHRDPRTGPSVPAAQPELPPTATLSSTTLEMNHFEATALAEGTAVLQWSGDIEDHFTIQVEPVVSARFVDPVRAFAISYALLSDADLASGAWGPDLGSTLVMAPGAQLAIGARLANVRDEEIATNSVLFGVLAGAELAVDHAGYATTVTAPMTGGGRLSLLHLGESVAQLDVVAAEPSSVTSLTLGFYDGLFDVVKATAALPDGQVLWQPPIVWELDPRLVQRDQAELLADTLGVELGVKRTDLLVIECAPGVVGLIEAEVVAHLGSVEQRIVVQVQGEPAVVDEAPSEESCSAGGAPAGLWLLGLGLCCSFGRARRASPRRCSAAV